MSITSKSERYKVREMEKCIRCGSKEIVFFCNGSICECNGKEIPRKTGLNTETTGDDELGFASHKYFCENCGLVMEELEEASFKRYKELKKYIQK